MRIRIMVAVLSAGACFASTVAAGADVTTTSGVHRDVFVSFSDYDPVTQRSVDGFLAIYGHVEARSAGVTAGPSIEYRATASRSSCDYVLGTCSSVVFDWQTVDPTALSIDPIANSVSIDACLLPSAGGPCRDFDLTMSRPANLFPSFLCYPLVVCGANAWHDPQTGESHAGITTTPGVLRSGYQVSGDFGGQPFPVITSGYADAQVWQRLVLNEQVRVP